MRNTICMSFQNLYIKKPHPRAEAYRIGAWAGDGSVTQITRQLLRKAWRNKQKEYR